MSDPRESIAGMLERYKVALYSKDVEAFADLYDANVRIFNASAQWSYDGLEQWRKSAETWFDSLPTERVIVLAEGMHISASRALGAANGFMIYRAISQAGVELRCRKSRFTWTVEKRLGVWKVVHEHTSLPFDLQPAGRYMGSPVWPFRLPAASTP